MNNIPVKITITKSVNPKIQGFFAVRLMIPPQAGYQDGSGIK